MDKLEVVAGSAAAMIHQRERQRQRCRRPFTQSVDSKYQSEHQTVVGSICYCGCLYD